MRSQDRSGLVVALSLSSFVMLLDLTIVSVAIPTIEARFGVSTAALQWLINAYTLCLATLMMAAGWAGDRFGRKRVFVGGLAAFVAGSILCAAAPSYGALIAGRVVQGVAAAAVIPGSLSILSQAFPEPAARAHMLGLLSSIGSLATVLGPLLGGLLVDGIGWWAIFVINVPLGIVAIVVGARSIRESADPEHASLDLSGQSTCALWLFALAYGLFVAGGSGWGSPLALGLLALSAVVFVAFVVIELRSARPMFPIRLFGSASFAVTNLASFILGFGAISVFFLLSLFLQGVQGYSASETGVRLVPLSVGIMMTGIIGGRLTASLGARTPMAIGYGAIGFALLGMLSLERATADMVTGALSVGLGLGRGLAFPSTSVAVIGAIPREQTGVASATVKSVQHLGNTVGIALLGTIVAQARLFSEGLHRAVFIAGAASLGAALMVALFLRPARH